MGRVAWLAGGRGLLPAHGVVIPALCLALLATGCKTIQGGPDRLYTVPQEGAIARSLLETSLPYTGLVDQYYSLPADGSAEIARKTLRNDIIARRMYIIDVEYSEYEAALTSERQKFGFATTTAAAGLGIAATLADPLRSAQIISGVGAGVLAARGAYDTDIVIAKTLQIVQGHMRAQRDDVFSKQIFPRITESTVTYPLSAALRDIEDYYRAGTFTSGLIPALRESGAAAEVAADAKALTVRGVFGTDDATRIVNDFIKPSGKLNRPRLTCVNRCLDRFPMLRGPGEAPINVATRLFEGSAKSAAIRAAAVQCIRQDPECSVLP